MPLPFKGFASGNYILYLSGQGDSGDSGKFKGDSGEFKGNSGGIQGEFKGIQGEFKNCQGLAVCWYCGLQPNLWLSGGRELPDNYPGAVILL